MGMNCPVCKYPNPQGATHCGMCYEVFHRSASQAYMRAVHNIKRQERQSLTPKVTPRSPGLIDGAAELFRQIDWIAVQKRSIPFLKRARTFLAAVAALAVCYWLLGSLLDLNPWYHTFGKNLRYAFSSKSPSPYMISLTQDIKIWSECQGRLDTPMQSFKVEEIANVLFEKLPADQKQRQEVALKSREWIQFLHGAAGSSSQALSPDNPSIADVRLVFDKAGTLKERRYKLSPRLAKGSVFLTPRFPKERQRAGRTWTESVEWLDAYGDWKVDWSGTLHWTLGDLEACGDDTCAHLTYQADLHPRLVSAPAWAAGALGPLHGQAETTGVTLFDASHKRLVSNTFSYAGTLHAPISDLGRIPRALRVGRRVKGVAGEIVIQLQNKIDTHRN